MNQEEALLKAKAWANNSYFSAESRKEIQDLIDNGDDKEIYERFYRELEFGTGGIRGILGQGSNRLNIYNVRKATQALATELLRTYKNQEIKVAISYDSRHFSKEFSEETACVLAGNGIKALLYARLNPVCLLSWSTRYHHAQAGVMVTASHNPPKYNGYKVYWSDGRQVTSPNDKNIIDNYNAITDYSTIKRITLEDAKAKGLLEYVGEDVEDAYINTVKDFAINKDLLKEHGSEIKAIYTPIHGTGLVPVTKLMKKLGLTNVSVVEEQRLPDGSFPTVTSPNPENASALALAVELLKKENGDLVVGTDPDADRIGLAIPHKGEIYYLNGNQIGSLLLYYIIEGKKAQGILPKNGYCVKTIVTTDLQKKIAEDNGFKMFDVLTGFKWLGGVMNDMAEKEPSSEFIFAAEESFGYLNHTYVRDKDAIGPTCLAYEMALYYKRQGKTLVDALHEIWERYGFFHEYLLNLQYEGSDGAQKIVRIMDMFRSYKEDTFAGYHIERVEDYEHGYQGLPASNVLCFRLDNGNKVLMRPSGTEPKIKFYIMLQSNEGTLDEKKAACQAMTDKIVAWIKDRCDNA